MKALLLATICAVLSFGQSYRLTTTGLSGPVQDYWATHQDIAADTQFSVLGAATYANGVAESSPTVYVDAAGTTHNLAGKVFNLVNDTALLKGASANIGLYSLGRLDMVTPSNTTTALVNPLSSFGTFAQTTVPIGWFGKCVSANTADVCNWKTPIHISVKGWLLIPVYRQATGSPFASHDETLIGSPDGGSNWLNAHDYWNPTVSQVVCASNVVTLTTATNTFTGAGQVLWVHGTGIASADGEHTATSSTSTSVTYNSTCTNATTAVTGYASPLDPNGAAPKCAASGGVATGVCTDAAYTDGTHSSMMWQEPTPYNGTSGIMQNVVFFNYCQDNSCTGMPDSADTYLYGFSSNGGRTSQYLFRVQKDPDHWFDPAQYKWYTQSGYTYTNTGNGSAGNWTATQASATQMWGQTDPSNTGTVPLMNWGPIGYGQVAYLCSGVACSLVNTTPNAPLGGYALPNSQHPWGPWFASGGYAQGSGRTAKGYFHLVPWSAFQVVDGSPFHLKVLGTWDEAVWGASLSITAITAANPAVVTVNTTFDGTWGGTVNGNVASATGCWAAINGNRNVTYISPTQFSIPVDTSACTGGFGSPTFLSNSSAYATQYWQTSDIVFQPTPIGQAPTGNSGIRFSMAQPSHALPRNGLQYYFDVFDHGGNTGITPIATYDQARLSNGAAQPFPTSALTPCYTNGCGFSSGGTGWSGNYGAIGGGGSFIGWTLKDMTGGAGTEINPAMFAGDSSYTFSIVVKVTDITQAASQNILGIGNTSGSINAIEINTYMGHLYFNLFNGSTSKYWQFQPSNAPLASGTWAMLTFVKTAGTPTLANSIIYVNGALAVALLATPAGSPSGLNIAAGPLTIGIYRPVGGQTLTGAFANFMAHNRALSASEVAAAYVVTKANLAKRGITLP
jgi:hypothetical protein